MPLTLNMVKKALSSYHQSLNGEDGEGWHADDGEKMGKGCFNIDFRDAELGDSANRTVTVCQKGKEFSVKTDDAMLMGRYDLSKATLIPKAINRFLWNNESCYLFIDRRAPVIECDNKTIMKEPIGNLVDHLETHHPFVIPSDLSLKN